MLGLAFYLRPTPFFPIAVLGLFSTRHTSGSHVDKLIRSAVEWIFTLERTTIYYLNETNSV